MEALYFGLCNQIWDRSYATFQTAAFNLLLWNAFVCLSIWTLLFVSVQRWNVDVHQKSLMANYGFLQKMNMMLIMQCSMSVIMATLCLEMRSLRTLCAAQAMAVARASGPHHLDAKVGLAHFNALTLYWIPHTLLWQGRSDQGATRIQMTLYNISKTWEL